MPAVKKPAALKLVNGKSEGTDSAGRHVPVPPPFVRQSTPCPKHITGYAREMWERVTEQLDSLHLLKELDCFALEMACDTYATWRVAKEKCDRIGLLGKNSQGIVVAPWVKIKMDSSKEFRSWCHEYGLTPSAEMNLATPGSGPDDPHAGNPFAGNG